MVGAFSADQDNAFVKREVFGGHQQLRQVIENHKHNLLWKDDVIVTLPCQDEEDEDEQGGNL